MYFKSLDIVFNKLRVTDNKYIGRKLKKVKKWKWSHLVVSNSATLWTVAHQAPLSMGFSKQENSSRPKDWTQASHIAGRCFNLWATREASQTSWEVFRED